MTVQESNEIGLVRMVSAQWLPKLFFVVIMTRKGFEVDFEGG